MKTLFEVIQGKDCGSRTGAMKKLATERAVSLCSEYVKPEQVEKMTNKVSIYQLAKAMNFIATGDGRCIDNVVCFAVLFLMLNQEQGKGAKFIDVHHAFSGTGKDGAKALPGISSAALRKTVGKVAPSTVTAQASRTVGVHGLFTMLGATVRDAHGFTVADVAHPFVQAYARRVSVTPEGTLLKALNLEPVTD